MGEHLGEDTPVGEHLDSLVGEELHVDNLVEKQLQTEAGSTTGVELIMHLCRIKFRIRIEISLYTV